MGAPLNVPRRALTVDEFDRMGEAGILTEDDRVELIEGELIEMAPIGGAHARLVNILGELLAQASGQQALVSIQNPIHLPPRNEPLPDIALLRPHMRRTNALATAEDVLLVVEIADTTLAYDRDTKMPLYGANGIPEAWLFDVQAQRVLVFFDPSPAGFRTMLTLTRDDTVTLRALPQVRIRLADVWL